MKLQIEKVAYGGAGLAHTTDGAADKTAVLVPFTLPGELVEAKIVSGGQECIEAQLLHVLEASSERLAPSCEHFGVCGGCQYQHVNYDAQVAMKTANLAEMLECAGLREIPQIQLHVREPWRYRNRIRLRIATIDGVRRAGYSARGTSSFMAVGECPIATPLLWSAAKALLHLSNEDGDFFGTLLQGTVEVEFFCNAPESALQMTLFVRGRSVARFAALCDRIKEGLPEFVGAGMVRLKGGEGRAARRWHRTEVLAAWGAEGLEYEVAGRGYWVARGGFFQVNRFLVEEMVGLVTGGRKGLLAWDLYAGVGLFSRVLAENFAEVMAVEGGEEASTELIRAMHKLGKKGVRASTAEFLRGAVVQRARPDLVVADPPRAGLGAEVCALLARIWAKELVYVSCDPVTLARDLKMLVDSGYRVLEVHMIDMFPQTFHIETVVVLRR